MSLSKFFGTWLLLLLLLLALGSRTTMEQPLISLPPSPSPSPSPSPGQVPAMPVLPQEEVKIVNKLLGLSRISTPTVNLSYSSTDCESLQFRGAIRCNCNSINCSVIAIDLSNWILTGRIPDKIGDLSELTYLSISNNLLSGNIPIELGNISSVTELYLYNNLLTGPLPPHLGNLSNLEEMYLMNNNFSGALPSELRNLEWMFYFNIQGNSFTGAVPDFIANWRRLSVLFLIGNNFEGPLPTNISALSRLTELAISGLAESPGGSFFPNMSNAIYLRSLTLRKCSLSGKIPDYIWQLPLLTYLDLSFNSLSGDIPENAKKKPNPMYIFLRGNKLTGPFPEWMLINPNISLDVSENHFSNTTKSGTKSPNKNLFECCSDTRDIYKAKKLITIVPINCSLQGVISFTDDHLYINCGGNETSISGIVYEADSNPNGTSTFFQSSNGAWAYSSMGKFFDSSRKEYLAKETCNISVEDAPLYITARVSPISLKYYGFCLKDDDYIVRLHFAEIGWDTAKFKDSGLKKRRVFNVEIQGQQELQDFNIEQEAGGVRKSITKEFNISINNSRLQIHLYWSGKGSIYTPKANYGPLISAISVYPVPKKHGKLGPAIISVVVVGSVLLFALMILGLCWKLGWLGKGQKGLELYPGGVFKFKQIKDATNGFAPTNKIGRGGFGAVYKGKLPNGDEIAVKQHSEKSRQGVSEFITEMGTIYPLNHPNLVKLKGCCIEEHQLLLVYEYMENRSLADALFGPDDVKAKLDWKRRVKICLDVAKGLAYLHEDCNLKLIHGDIKPSNVLLDKDFNAKISDFGFARTHERRIKNARPDEGETTPTNTQIKGTQGYIAPECMKAKYSPKVDVYSFGILTLEIISGQQSSTPSARGQTVYLLEKAYECLRHRNPTGLLDSSLGSQYDDKVAKKIIYLAMQCINHDPDQRPTMSDVVKILEGKKKIENILVPVAVDDLSLGKSTFTFSQSSHSASTSIEVASESTLSLSTSKEIDESSI